MRGEIAETSTFDPLQAQSESASTSSPLELAADLNNSCNAVQIVIERVSHQDIRKSTCKSSSGAPLAVISSLSAIR